MRLQTTAAVAALVAFGLAGTAVFAQEKKSGGGCVLAGGEATMVMAGDYEFFSRPEWTALVDAYGLRFRDRRSMDASLMYGAVASAQVDVISAFSTDGRIAALGLTVLTDDRHVIPPYDAVLLASPRLAREAHASAAARPILMRISVRVSSTT